MSFWILLLRTSIKALGKKMGSQAALQNLVQREVNKAMGKGFKPPDIKKIINQQLTPTEQKSLDKIFKSLGKSPEAVLDTLLKNPASINKLLESMPEDAKKEFQDEMDKELVGEEGKLVLVGVSSSWIAAIQYQKIGLGYQYWFTTKDGRGPYGPETIPEQALKNMLAATGTHGSGAGTEMWKSVPYWIRKRNKGKKQTNFTKALRGF